MIQKGCRHFNGYKPCGKHDDCNEYCPSLSIPKSRILVVHLGALGAVLRSTAILPALKRKHSQCSITWVTESPAQHLLQGLPQLDQVLTLDFKTSYILKNQKFDAVYCLDKSLLATGIASSVFAKNRLGFTSDENGVIVPLNKSANELWEIGLSNHLKFHVNKKTELELLFEALELGPFKGEEYQICLTEKEKNLALDRKKVWAPNGEILIGINTGCSSVIPYKKLSVNFHKNIIRHFSQFPNVKVVLLGGKEDTERNSLISSENDAIVSPTERGLRDGLSSVEACDIVISGDSLGMHMGIGLKKWMIAWFGPTCAHEIELYGRGEKILTQAACSPCWKRTCNKNPMCYDLVNFDEMIASIERGISCIRPSSKLHFSETSF